MTSKGPCKTKVPPELAPYCQQERYNRVCSKEMLRVGEQGA